MYSYLDRLRALNDVPEEARSPSPPNLGMSNSARMAFLGINGGAPAFNTPSAAGSPIPGRSNNAYNSFLEMNGLAPTSRPMPAHDKEPEPSAFERNRPFILRRIYGSARSYTTFFATLRSALSGLTADEAAEIVGQVMESITRAVGQLDLSAEDADGGQFSFNPMKDSSRIRGDFDRAVANLSGVMQKISGSDAGGRYCGAISTQIARLISRRDDIGRWDEALGNTLVNGDFRTMEQVKGGKDVEPELLGQGSSILAAQVVGLLNNGQRIGFGSSSDRDKANDILENIEKGAKLLREAHDKLTERTMSDNSELQTNVGNWGAFATEEQLQNAISAQKESHGTFAQLEAMAGNTLQIFDSLNQLSTTLPDDDIKDKLNNQVNKYIETFSDSVSLTQSGTSYYEQMIEQWGFAGEEEKEGSFINNVIDRTKDVTGKGKSAIELLAGLYLKSEMSSLLESAAEGDIFQARNIFDNIIDKSGRLGIDQEDLAELSKSFSNLRSASDPEAALADFNRKAEDITAFDSSTTLGRNLKLVGLALATVNFVQNLPEGDEVDIETVIRSSADAVGLGQAGLALLTTNAAWKETVSSGLKQAGRGLSLVGLGFSVHDTAKSIDNGDWSGALVGGMGVVSGALGLMGFGGPAFAVGLAAMAISFQMARVEASNILETEHTEAFLQELGIPEDVTHHLRNADSEGRSIGFALQEVMTLSGASREVFLNALVELTPEQALDLAEACHGVDPNGNGELPMTDEFAQYAGMSWEELEQAGVNLDIRGAPSRYRRHTRPRSVEGLRNYIARQGIPLPVGGAR